MVCVLFYLKIAFHGNSLFCEMGGSAINWGLVFNRKSQIWKGVQRESVSSLLIVT